MSRGSRRNVCAGRGGYALALPFCVGIRRVIEVPSPRCVATKTFPPGPVHEILNDVEAYTPARNLRGFGRQAQTRGEQELQQL